VEKGGELSWQREMNSAAFVPSYLGSDHKIMD
jgi:hypothetical protein